MLSGSICSSFENIHSFALIQFVTTNLPLSPLTVAPMLIDICIKVLTSLLSMILEFTALHPSVLISGTLGLILSPYAAFQQRKLTQTEALHQTNELLEHEVNHLSIENSKLTKQVQHIEESVSKLGAMEAALEAINSLQGESVGKLEQHLQESKDILSRMESNIQAAILQNLVTVMLSTDADQNMMLSNEEIDELIQNLEGINGIQLKEDQVRKTIIEHGRSVGAIMEVARQALATCKSGTDSMFSFVE